MSECEVRGNVYRINRMNARKQFHVMRRLAPVLTGIIDPTTVAPSDAETVGDFLHVAGPIVDAIGALSDENADYIIDACLDVVQRQQGLSIWSPVKLLSNGQLMFDDIDMAVMLELCWRVIQENMESFFAEGRSEVSVGPRAA